MNRLYLRIVGVYFALLGAIMIFLYFDQSSQQLLIAHPAVYFIVAAYLIVAGVLCWLNKTVGLILEAVYFIAEIFGFFGMMSTTDLVSIGAAICLIAAVIERIANRKRKTTANGQAII